MHMFLVNFGLENFNCTLLEKLAKGLLEEELRNCVLIEKPIKPKKLDGKVALMPAIPVVRPLPWPAQAPR